MSLPQSQLLTVEEYLALERASEERHEFLDGQVYAMSGESLAHGDICTNLIVALGSQLRGTACRVVSKDMKVQSGPAPAPRYSTKGLFSYPDLVVVCGEPQFHDHHKDVLLNPVVIIEVLSPSTEAFDRGEKWSRYQTWLPSLIMYVLVSQQAPKLEYFLRERDGGWFYSSVHGLDGILHIEAIDCHLRLADVYDRIVFPAESEDSIRLQ
jgi:Uma2 family endonuclease